MQYYQYFVRMRVSFRDVYEPEQTFSLMYNVKEMLMTMAVNIKVFILLQFVYLCL